MAVLHVRVIPEAGVRLVSEQGGRDEVHEIGAEMGARVVRAVDPRGEHRLRGEDGTYNEDL